MLITAGASSVIPLTGAWIITPQVVSVWSALHSPQSTPQFTAALCNTCCLYINLSPDRDPFKTYQTRDRFKTENKDSVCVWESGRGEDSCQETSRKKEKSPRLWDEVIDMILLIKERETGRAAGIRKLQHGDFIQWGCFRLTWSNRSIIQHSEPSLELCRQATDAWLTKARKTKTE